MKKLVLVILLVSSFVTVGATKKRFGSPDGRLSVVLNDEGGTLRYQVLLSGTVVLKSSPLGLMANVGDYSKDLKLVTCETREVSDDYELSTIKQRRVSYRATEVICQLEQGGQHVMDITFRISNRDVAFRYKLYPKGDTRVCVVEGEASGFVLPDGTTSFLCPQAKPMGGFARTSPSYETQYTSDEPIGKNGWGEGYTFPCLFKTDNQNWVLLSETGTDGRYVGCRLLNDGGGNYHIGFPQAGEMNGIGSTSVAMSLPCETPWRTITVGTLKDIVETTVAFDLVQPKYQASQAYTYGKGSWSWIIGMDGSCNYDEQRRYIDFSAAMGYQSVLIDALWDQQIGYERIGELARYGCERGVGLFLWYNSNSSWNDAPQTPIDKMSDSRTRRQEMQWMKDCGIRGIKVDFFGGDKQPMMQLYEDILSDANDFGLMVIFHGCTLPRGWERMYPNYVASEAVLASENLHFSQAFCDNEARNACLHPFIRNTVGSMDFGGSTLNKHYNADNQHGTTRRTSDVFALATAVLFQSPVQHFALAPNNLTDAPEWAIEFMKQVPTTWDEVRFIDGYPGRCVILARRSGSKWYVAGINAEATPVKATLKLDMFEPGTSLQIYSDDQNLNGSVKPVKLNKKQSLTVSIPTNGAIVITN